MNVHSLIKTREAMSRGNSNRPADFQNQIIFFFIQMDIFIASRFYTLFEPRPEPGLGQGNNNEAPFISFPHGYAGPFIFVGDYA
jgi:hypothetical protein